MRRSTIREVALRAGVSYQTVSRVINNSPDVAEATHEQVLRVIAELNYHPNAQAVSLSRNRTDIIGIIVDTVTFTFFAQTIDRWRGESALSSRSLHAPGNGRRCHPIRCYR